MIAFGERHLEIGEPATSTAVAAFDQPTWRPRRR
jgi:hypothetical protein